MKTIRDNVIVKADDPNDHVNLKCGKKIWIDTSFDPGRYAVISGEVIAVGPKVKDIRKGDKIYFHFNCYRDDYRLFHGDDDMLRIPYHLIYCKLRNGKLEMLEDTLLAEPVIENVSNEKVTGSGVIIPNVPKHKKLQAIIKYLPKTYEGELEVGDKVIYSLDSDIPIKIEGKEYFRMKIDWILAKFINNKN